MKAGWKTAKLGEVCTLIARGIAPKYIEEGGTRVLNQKCVRDHAINYALARRHDATTKRIAHDRFIQVGDVLINSTGTGTLGRVAQVRSNPLEPTTVDTHVTIVRPLPGEFYRDFFGYALVLLEDQLVASGEGASGQTELARTTVTKFEISYPTDIEEQRRIVAVLDEAFAAISTATANAEKNLSNARELFESYLNEAFNYSGADMRPLESLCDQSRVITYGVIKLGEHEAAGVPCLRTSNVRWLNIDTDGMKCIAPSLSQEYKRTILKGGEVLVNVRGTLGGVAVVLPHMSGWNVSREVAVVPPNFRMISPNYLAYWIGTRSGQSWLSGVEKGLAYSGINISDLRTLPVPIQSLSDQQEIVAQLDTLKGEARLLESAYSSRIAALARLKQSLLHQAFSGDLTAVKVEPVLAVANDNFAMPKGSAQVIAFAYWVHKNANRDKSFKHVKAQKCLHNIESIAAIDLGRQPRKFPYGPHDPVHMARAEDWARQNGFFEFVPSTSGQGLDFQKLANYDALLAETLAATKPLKAALERAIEPLVPMNMEEAELFATVHAAWNNLLHDGATISDDAIVTEARENWDRAKTIIPRHRFLDTIKLIRRKRMEPDGSGKYVGGQARLF